MNRKLPYIIEPTSEENAAIREAIAGDPDTWEAPENATVKRRGRPFGSHKTRVTMRLDDDVLEALKTPTAKGWQTRANTVLRKALL